MTNTNFRKRRRDLDRFKMDLLPIDVFPEDALLLEFQGRRISNILLDFASNLLSGIDKENTVQFKTMMYLSAVAWNFSYFEAGKERKEALDRFLLSGDLFNEGNRSKMYTIVDGLSARKRSAFWQYDFMIVNFEIVKGVKESTVLATAVPYALINIGSAFGPVN
ncbi:MAG TPA: hypothetical protein PK514_03685 [Spirochaetota bacterium]|nr:hypothetical protein [Spirochaetota bacterium]